MEKKHFITIAGKLGSGKSTTAKGVAKELSYTHYSTGDIFRSIAAERGLTITELNTQAENEPSIDHEVDNRTAKLGEEESDVVMDSRIAFHFVPESFKVFLDIDNRVAAERIFASIQDNDPTRATEHQAENLDDFTADMNTRVASEKKRYLDLYGIHHQDHDNFDLVIDTGNANNDPETVIAKVVEAYNAWLIAQ